jgi:hypothetical protein
LHYAIENKIKNKIKMRFLMTKYREGLSFFIIIINFFFGCFENFKHPLTFRAKEGERYQRGTR